MPSFESQIESSLEQLQMDERLRSNLIDDEAKLLLEWATTRLMDSAGSNEDEAIGLETVRAETRRVKSALRIINDLFADDHNPTPTEALTALSLPLDQTVPPLPDRAALIKWLLAQLSTAWTNPSTAD
jgi:hypothetical protein